MDADSGPTSEGSYRSSIKAAAASVLISVQQTVCLLHQGAQLVVAIENADKQQDGIIALYHQTQ